MLKALQILNFIKDNKNLDLLHISKVDEAIAELEALENRCCENCKHYKQSKSHIYKTCFKIKTNGFNLESDVDFYCNKWEDKDTLINI